MTPDAWLVVGVLGASLVAFVTEILPVDLVAVLVMVALVLSGVLTPDVALEGFSNSALVTVAAMFVLSAGLMRTGALESVGSLVSGATRGGRKRQVAVLMIVAAVVSAFMNNTPVAILFLPIVLGLSQRLDLAPSRLLIPLSYATILGGTCTLIGTSTNLLVAHEAERAGHPPIGIFEFAVPGLIYASVGMAFLALLGPKLLPKRASATTSIASGRLREFVTEVSFSVGSPLVGKSFQELLKGAPGIVPLMVIRGEETYTAPLVSNPKTQFIRDGDVLLLRGAPDAINSLLSREGVSLPPELGAAMAQQGVGKAVTMVELVITPNSPLIGRTLGGVGFSRRHGNASVLAVLRREEHLRERVAEIRLRLGDTLLVVVDEGNLDSLRQTDEFVLLEGVDAEVARRRKAPTAAAIMLGVVVLAAAGVLPISILALAGAAVMVVTGCLPLRVAYNSLELSVLVLIAGMLALARAFEQTGLVQVVSAEVVGALQPHGPHAVIAGIFLISAAVTNFASNNAVAVLMTPIALDVARGLELAPEPFLYSVLFGASCAFATPIAYQTNLFVYGPGNYRFRDYVRIGVPLTLLLFGVAMLVIPWWFPFSPGLR